MSDSHLRTLHNLSTQGCWRNASFLSKHQYPSSVWPWLDDRHSLTSQLIALSNTSFEVKLLRQTTATPRFHEQDQLNQAHHCAATIREVALCVDGVDRVLARSVIPMTLMNAYGSGLTDLGTKPLGHLLFTDGKARMSRRQFARFKLNEMDSIFARRTPYEYLGSTILVAEFFLPTLNDKLPLFQGETQA